MDRFAFVRTSDNFHPEFVSHKYTVESTVSFDNIDDLAIKDDFKLTELKQVINCWSDSSPGDDGISNVMFKYLPESSLQVLLLLFSRVWLTMPVAWGKAIVVPVSKPGKCSSDPSSYRPISLTSNVWKLMEWLVNSRLNWSMEKNNILSLAESGIHGKRYTTDHVVTLGRAIKNALINWEIFFTV